LWDRGFVGGCFYPLVDKSNQSLIYTIVVVAL
jgi:hypothetical protein